MSGQVPTKVRLVRCPKCQLVLPELAEVPVYKCGGCGTILQAKKRKAAPTKNDGPEHDPQGKEVSSGASVNKLKGLDQGGAEGYNEELHQQINSPNELPSSSGLSCLEKEDPLPKHEGEEHSCILNDKTEPLENESQDQSKELSGGGISNGLLNSDQLTSHEMSSPLTEAKEDDAEGSPLAEREQLELDKGSGCPSLETKQDVGGLTPELTATELDEDSCHVDHCTVKDKDEGEVSEMMLGSLDESPSLSESVNHSEGESVKSQGQEYGIKSESLVQESTERDQNNFRDHNAEPSENMSYANEASLSTESARNEIEKQSSVNSEMYQSLLNESMISDTLMSPDHEQLEQFQTEIPSAFDRISSADTLENLPVNTSEHERPDNLRKMIRSPTNGSYYAYDGSASSCDGEDHKPNQFHQQPGRKFKEAYPVSPSEFHLDDRYRVSNTMSIESEIQQQAMKFSSTLPGKNHQATEDSNWSHAEWSQFRKRGQGTGNIMTSDNDEHVAAFPFILSGSDTGYKRGNPPSYRKNVAHHSSLHPSRMPLNSEPDKIELLRMVYELEDQLRQTRIAKGIANGRFSTETMRDEEYTPSYYDQFLADGEVGADFSYSRYPVRFIHGKGRPQQRKSTGIPFSAEAAHYRHQADCLCLHCAPQVRRYSAQLPPPVCSNKGRRVAYSSCNHCNHLQSGCSSPQHYSSSEYSRWDHEKKADDRRHNDHEMKKLYLREKYSKMRHVRPVAGGSPIITCYHCNQLLQLPADFLLFRRRCHQLRCHACRKVLKFTLQNQMHVVPLYSEALAPPPSEVDGNSDAIDQRNMAYAYHSSSCPHTEPISCSDDLGPSFCLSCSTEGESSLPPIQPIRRTSLNGEMSSRSSSIAAKDGKLKSVLQEPYIETFGSPRHSSKMSKWGKASSEIEEVRPTAGSPLHRLMGYSSPSEVIQW